MPRPTRKHPLIRLHESPEAQTMIGNIVAVLDGFDYRPVARVGLANVFRIDGPTGSGLLADSSEPVADRPGVYVTTASAWVRGAGADTGWILDGRFHSWDAGTAAAATGDRSVVDGPRARMYRVRDQRTAEAARADSLAVGEVPPGAVPALMAGLSAEQVRGVAEEFAPELLV